MATTTNYSWTTPDDTALVKDGAAAIRSLGTAIDTTVFTNAGAAIAKATVDAKGDLIAGTADNTIARLAVGANDTILVADSSTATGLKWAAPAAAASGLNLITSTSYTTQTSVVVNNCFSATYRTYKIIITTGADGIFQSSASLKLRASGTNVSARYQTQRLRVENTTVTASQNRLGTDEYDLGQTGTSTYRPSLISLEISSPYVAEPTSIIHTTQILTSLGAGESQFYTGMHEDASQWDGFNLLFDTNTSGTIRVYGYGD
jgi:hypothetical protein